jgi:hypothetical protein
MSDRVYGIRSDESVLRVANGEAAFHSESALKRTV